VALGVAAAGSFLGPLLAILLSEVAGVRLTRRLLMASVLVATAAAAWVVWSLMGYDAVAGQGSARPQRDATPAEKRRDVLRETVRSASLTATPMRIGRQEVEPPSASASVACPSNPIRRPAAQV
jgi:hypothetical protein